MRKRKAYQTQTTSEKYWLWGFLIQTEEQEVHQLPSSQSLA